jgi:putative flippase GtrA
VIQQFISKQFLIFLLTGGTAAVVNFGSCIVYNLWFDYSTSILIAYLTGMVTAFVLTRMFVFTETSLSVRRSAFYFSMVNVVAVSQTWAISMALANYVLPSMGISRFIPEIAHAVGVAFPVFTSYLGHKHWSFR